MAQGPAVPLEVDAVPWEDGEVCEGGDGGAMADDVWVGILGGSDEVVAGVVGEPADGMWWVGFDAVVVARVEAAVYDDTAGE